MARSSSCCFNSFFSDPENSFNTRIPSSVWHSSAPRILEVDFAVKPYCSKVLSPKSYNRISPSCLCTFYLMTAGGRICCGNFSVIQSSFYIFARRISFLLYSGCSSTSSKRRFKISPISFPGVQPASIRSFPVTARVFRETHCPFSRIS